MTMTMTTTVPSGISNVAPAIPLAGRALLPMTWRKAINADVPKYGDLLRHSQDDQSDDIFVRTSNLGDIREIRNWIEEFCHGRVKLFGRYSYAAYSYWVDTQLDGLVFRFSNINDAVYFRLRFMTEV